MRNNQKKRRTEEGKKEKKRKEESKKKGIYLSINLPAYLLISLSDRQNHSLTHSTSSLLLLLGHQQATDDLNGDTRS